MAQLSVVPTKEKNIAVNFTCQRCCQPLKLDSSFVSIDDRIMAELATPQNKATDDLDALPRCRPIDDDPSIVRRVIQPLSLVESGNGFMVVGDQVMRKSNSESYSHQLEVTARLFDLMTDQSDVEHPLCEECADTLIDYMEKQLDLAEQECKDYRKFLAQLDEQADTKDDVDALDRELEQLALEENELMKQLMKIEEERQTVQQDCENLKNQREALQAEDARFYRLYADVKRQLFQCEDDQMSIETQQRYAQYQLDRLEKTNAFNATFHIWHDGHFATINNFRLGRLNEIPVEYAEINMAWGQTVLLLHALTKKMNFTFKRYRLVPYGNHSYLEALDDKSSILQLYHRQSSFRIGFDLKFDSAMVAFLDCVKQFAEEVKQRSPGFNFPYPMDGDKIQDVSAKQAYSIKLQCSTEEEWTKALKYMLTNLKWGLAWICSQFVSRSDSNSPSGSPTAS